MVETGTYKELLEGSESFGRLLENIHQQKQELHESATSNELKRLSRCLTISEADNDEPSPSTENLESREVGSVKWRVYVSYVQAGAGLIFGIFLMVLVFGAREAISIFYGWWLAQWSDDEGHRHRQFNNCSEVNHSIISPIKSMSTVEWNQYTERKFVIYAGS